MDLRSWAKLPFAAPVSELGRTGFLRRAYVGRRVAGAGRGRSSLARPLGGGPDRQWDEEPASHRRGCKLGVGPASCRPPFVDKSFGEERLDEQACSRHRDGRRQPAWAYRRPNPGTKRSRGSRVSARSRSLIRSDLLVQIACEVKRLQPRGVHRIQRGPAAGSI